MRRCKIPKIPDLSTNNSRLSSEIEIYTLYYVCMLWYHSHSYTEQKNRKTFQYNFNILDWIMTVWFLQERFQFKLKLRSKQEENKKKIKQSCMIWE